MRRRSRGESSAAPTRLHLDADALIKALERALRSRGHDVTRTPPDWMPRDATHEEQLLGATVHGRCILTFNVRAFVALSRKHDRHAGIVLAAQSSWSLTGLISALHRLLSETTASEWIGQVRWLNDWRE